MALEADEMAGAMTLKRQSITLVGYTRNKTVDAVIVGERVAVHREWFDCGWSISDPISGYVFTSRIIFPSELSALRAARDIVSQFGTNPLKGAIISGDGFQRKPKQYADIKAFFAGLRQRRAHA